MNADTAAVREYRTIQLGDHHLDVLVARTPTQWARGLADGTDGAQGMLFVMAPESHMGFHAGGVTDPLVVAFFAEDGTLLSVRYLDPEVGVVQPERPYTYALELPVHQIDDIGPFLTALTAGLRLP